MRLFIAIEFDNEILGKLIKVQEDLKALGLEGRYVPEENLHLTLAFIGEYDDPDKVLEVMRQVPMSPIRIRMSRIGCFGDLWWIGIDDNPALYSYVRRLRNSLSGNGIPFDAKKFKPHITLVRKGFSDIEKNKILSFMSKSFIIGTTVRQAALVKSEFGENGMKYTVLGQAKGNANE